MNSMNHNVYVTVRPIKRYWWLTPLSIIGIGYAAWSEIRRRRQDEELYQLSRKVDALERSKGEQAM